MNAMMIDGKDNVAVAIEPIKKGEEITFLAEGETRQVRAVQDIEIYHKMALCHIGKGQPIIKYGEHIGLALEEICAGSHVHVHNVESHREEL